MNHTEDALAEESVEMPAADLDAFLDAAEAVDWAIPTEVAIKDILRDLSVLVPCDLLFWTRLDPQTSSMIALVGYPCAPYAATVSDWMAHVPPHPICTGGCGPIVPLGHVGDPGEPHHSWLYQICWRQTGLGQGIGISLGHPHGEIQDVIVCRWLGPDFNDRDHVILRLLRPHLDVALHRLAYPAPRLTPRELEVLRYVRDGMPSHQIAHALDIAESTVIKHLEHIYARTGAHSRTQAVQLCLSALD
jgi:DNA-binding CsgD family transcriptional regulator